LSIGLVETILIVVILVAAAPYVLGPVLVYRRQRQSPRPSFEPFNSNKHSVLPQLQGLMGQNAASLERAGFKVVADLFRTDRATRMRVILMDTPAEDLAVLLGVSPALRPERGACSVELVAWFEGDRSLTVQNSPIPGAFAPVTGRDRARFRTVRDPARLYRIYQALLARRYGAARRAAPDYRTDPPSFLAAAMSRELRQQVGTGYFRLDSAADVYRPTWKGAWLMCWKLLQPFRDIREWLSDQRARALLRELGLEGEGAEARPVAVAPRPPSVSHWNWITVVAGSVVLIVHPRFLGQGLPSLGPPGGVRMRLPASFAVPADFPGAVTALERLAGASATPLVVQDSLGNTVRTDGVIVPVEGKRAEGLVAAAQDSFLARGFYLFRVVQNFGAGGRPDTLALYPSPDRYAILRLVGTNGANYQIGPDSIVAWLKALERDQPFVLTGIGFDWVGGRFTTPLTDPGALALAQRFNAFCPDIVTQGTETVAELARELERSGELYCWWD
jgi:uncharacterized protein DUF4253